MFTRRIVYDQARLLSLQALSFRLLNHVLDPPRVNRFFHPRSFAEKTQYVRLVRTVQDTSADIRHAFVLKHYQSRQVVLKVAYLLTIFKQFFKRSSVLYYDRCGLYYRYLHRIPSFFGFLLVVPFPYSIAFFGILQ
jgi:hypothetical protein